VTGRKGPEKKEPQTFFLIFPDFMGFLPDTAELISVNPQEFFSGIPNIFRFLRKNAFILISSGLARLENKTGKHGSTDTIFTK
jgi:hypothetical protein